MHGCFWMLGRQEEILIPPVLLLVYIILWRMSMASLEASYDSILETVFTGCVLLCGARGRQRRIGMKGRPGHADSTTCMWVVRVFFWTLDLRCLGPCLALSPTLWGRDRVSWYRWHARWAEEADYAGAASLWSRP